MMPIQVAFFFFTERPNEKSLNECNLNIYKFLHTDRLKGFSICINSTILLCEDTTKMLLLLVEFEYFSFFLNLQWLGESDLRFKMQGRLILVHLMCRDMAASQSIDSIIGLENDIAGN